jgi:hypothetical protein
MRLAGELKKFDKPITWKDLNTIAVKNNIVNLERALFSALDSGMLDAQFWFKRKETL